jgi:hypothetical protein
MPDKFDPDERFKLDAEPEEVIKKLLGEDEVEPEDAEDAD